MTEETITTTTTTKVTKDDKGHVLKEENLPPRIDKKDVTLVQSVLGPETQILTHASVDESGWKNDITEGAEGK